LINFTSCPLPGQDAFPVPEVSGVKVWLDAGITIERFAELPSTGGRGLAEAVWGGHRHRGSWAGRYR